MSRKQDRRRNKSHKAHPLFIYIYFLVSRYAAYYFALGSVQSKQAWILNWILIRNQLGTLLYLLRNIYTVATKAILQKQMGYHHRHVISHVKLTSLVTSSLSFYQMHEPLFATLKWAKLSI